MTTRTLQDADRFTQRARRVLSSAYDQASDLRHDKIYPEHVLIGLVEEGAGVAGRVLRDLGLDADRVRKMVERLRPPGDKTIESAGRIELDSSTEQLLRLAVDEAARLGHHYIGTEHLLLASILQVESNAVEALRRLGLTAAQIRRQTRRVLQESAVLKPTSFSLASEYGEVALSMENQIEALRKLASTIQGKSGDSASTNVQELSQIADKIEESRRELTAPVTLPSTEDMSIRLVPSHFLERLEEYRSDEGIALLVTGLFGGGVLGVLISLATGEVSRLSPFSIVLLILMIMLAVLSGYWIAKMRSRISKIRDRMLWPEKARPIDDEKA